MATDLMAMVKSEGKQLVQVIPVSRGHSERRNSLRFGTDQFHAACLQRKRRCGDDVCDYNEKRDRLVREKNFPTMARDVSPNTAGSKYAASEQANIAGAGINMAQRVMDCGDAGHILLSKRLADDLEQYPQWRPYLHEFGECKASLLQVSGGRFRGGLRQEIIGNVTILLKISLLKHKAFPDKAAVR
jgi:hypothetical protein